MRRRERIIREKPDGPGSKEASDIHGNPVCPKAGLGSIAPIVPEKKGPVRRRERYAAACFQALERFFQILSTKF